MSAGRSSGGDGAVYTAAAAVFFLAAAPAGAEDSPRANYRKTTSGNFQFCGDNLVYEKNLKNLLFSTGKERKNDIRC
jgi:hypothetical protein